MSTAGSAMAATSLIFRGLKDARMLCKRARREVPCVGPAAELSAHRGVGAMATIVFGVLMAPGVLLLPGVLWREALQGAAGHEGFAGWAFRGSACSSRGRKGGQTVGPGHGCRAAEVPLDRG